MTPTSIFQREVRILCSIQAERDLHLPYWDNCGEFEPIIKHVLHVYEGIRLINDIVVGNSPPAFTYDKTEIANIKSAFTTQEITLNDAANEISKEAKKFESWMGQLDFTKEIEIGKFYIFEPDLSGKTEPASILTYQISHVSQHRGQVFLIRHLYKSRHN